MCAPYWPDEVGKTLHFNDFIIEIMGTKDFEDYTQREFKLTKESVSVLCSINSWYVVLFASKRLVTLTQSFSIITLGGQNMALLAQVLA